MFLKLRRHRVVGLYLFLSFLLVATSIPLFPNVSKADELTSNEMLDVGFGGAFSSETGYTNPTGEIKDGALTRRTGKEEIKGSSVFLNGGKDGIDFKSRTSLGGNTVDKSFIVEAEFNPDSSPNFHDTLLSIGGNMFVRYTSASTLEYGFDVNHNGKWTSVKESISAPKANEAHSIAVIYEPTELGAKMSVYIDGKELQAVESDKGRPVFADTDKKIGFGNEVHSQGKDRGFKGELSRVILTNFDGAFHTSLLKTMEPYQLDRTLSIYGNGHVSDSTYSPSGDETVSGAIEVIGGEIDGIGRLKMGGDHSNIAFHPEESLLDTDKLSADYIAEILTEPAAVEPGTILIDLAGAVVVRRSLEKNAIDILINNQIEGTVEITENESKEYVHLSVFYKNTDQNQAEVSVWSGETQLGNTVQLTKKPIADRDSILFAGSSKNDIGSSLQGEVYGVAFAKLEGKFSPNLLGLIGGPCTIPSELEPGNRIAISANECSAALAAKASLVRPKPKQVTWQQYEQTAFIHYGINTYYGVEWGGFNLDANKFQPTDLDTDQWARTLKESGFKMAVITVKHHDGFTLYPSRYTDFGVGSSSWRDGNGDVLREFVDSMRKYGLDVGVYLSPADHQAYSDNIFANGSSRSNRTIPTLVDGDEREGDTNLPTLELPATDYGEMLLNQLYEVLTEYGKIDEVWFDGAQGNIPGNVEEKYDWDSYYELIETLQPQAVVAVTGHDVRWVGNESGFARENEWSVLGAGMSDSGRQHSYPSYQSSDLGSRSALEDAAANGMEYLTWWPSEVDVSIRPGWFYHENQQPKSLNDLRNIYYNSVARNSVLLLNVPPNKEGKFDEKDVARLKEWHQSIKQDFAINHALDATVTAENGAEDTNPELVRDVNYETAWQAASTEPSSITFDFSKEVEIDRVVLQEDINHGQQVESFAIDVLRSNGEWEEVYANNVIGYKRIATLNKKVTGQKFQVRILKSRGPVHLSEIGFYETLPNGEALPPVLGVKNATVTIGDKFDLKSLITIAEDGEGNDLQDAVEISKGDFTIAKPGKYEITFTLQVEGFEKIIRTATVTVKGDGHTPSVTTISELKVLVEQFEKDGEFSDGNAVYALQLHLAAVVRYENQENAKKIVKHLNGFKDLLDYQKVEVKISEKAYGILISNTDQLINKWE